VSTREELEARLKAKEAAADAARAEQVEIDEMALLEAKLEHEPHEIAVMRLSRHAVGHPTLVIVKKPSGPAYKRWRDLLLRNERNKALGHMSADCLLYPSVDAFAAMAKVFPELPDQVAITGAALAKGGAEEEGKS
jgi:hypothetical protein